MLKSALKTINQSNAIAHLDAQNTGSVVSVLHITEKQVSFPHAFSRQRVKKPAIGVLNLCSVTAKAKN